MNPHAAHCGHIFCLAHIMKWMDMSNTCCPTCRRPLTFADLFKVYADDEDVKDESEVIPSGMDSKSSI